MGGEAHTDFSEMPSARPKCGVEKLMSSCFLPCAETDPRFVVASMPRMRGERSRAIAAAILSANRTAY